MSYRGPRKLDSPNHRWLEWFIPFLSVIVLLRLILTLAPAYRIDMAGYYHWSVYLADHGPSTLYTHPSFHIVYAPFYQYCLWMTAELSKLFHMSVAMHTYCIKLWSVLFELAGSALILLFAQKYGKVRQGAVAALLYAINPGIFMNSSIWGQFDPIPATMLLGVLYLFDAKKPNPAAILFLVAVLTKPQSGLLLPIVLYLYFKDFKLDGKSFLRLFTGLLAGIGVYLLIVLPFYQPTAHSGNGVPPLLDPFYWLIDLYTRSLQDYPYATANAFNLWTLLGGQVMEDTLPFAGLTYLAWGNILLVLSLLFCGFMVIRARGSFEGILYGSFLILFSAFLFMTKMHERYLLPAILLGTLSAVWHRRHILTVILVSMAVFANQLSPYLLARSDQYWLPRWDAPALLIAAVTLATYILAVYQGYRLYIRPEPNQGQTIRRIKASHE